ncbi:uncharacterized protein TNIN_21351 [Trichonephila inaurata madagascariensis]|uniref:Uncharacterized protein n=1 Tax=Trichonephila inaurata madagascariensis TaxID=2747483 RepID=A0A8X7BUG2_9ARAC|nr:uncharacterized protein TNIN_21351 [Trichonephila inaurata madagascariensis]
MPILAETLASGTEHRTYPVHSLPKKEVHLVFGGSTLPLLSEPLVVMKRARTLAKTSFRDFEKHPKENDADMLRSISVEDFQHCYQQWEQRLHWCGARNQRRSDTHQLITAIITPPPDYNTVIKKDSICEPAPPTYEVAMSGLRSDGYV